MTIMTGFNWLGWCAQ